MATAEEVRALMARRRVSQEVLATVIGVTQTQVSKRLRGRIPFDVDEIELIADYFQVDPRDLLGERPNSGPENPAMVGAGGRNLKLMKVA